MVNIKKKIHWKRDDYICRLFLYMRCVIFEMGILGEIQSAGGRFWASQRIYPAQLPMNFIFMAQFIYF